MFEYKSEAVKIPVKVFKDSFDDAVVASLDELMNKREAEGFEFVQHSVATSIEIGCYLIVTFRKTRR